LLAFSGDSAVQELVAEALRSAKTTPATHRLILQVLARSRVEPLPKSWTSGLDQALSDSDLAVRREAVSTIKARNLTGFDAKLLALSRQTELPAELRVAALDCVAGRLQPLPAESFALLTAHVSAKAEPLLRVAAARALGASMLDTKQLVQTARHVAEAGPLHVPLLLPAFTKSRDATVGLALAEALQRSSGTDALAADDLETLLRGYPAEVQQAGRPILQRLAVRQKEQAAYLAALTHELLQTPGSAQRGREVFFSKKAACYACHRAAGQGGNVGPDLSQVGRFRTTRDLLESIVFPSSSIVPQYRSFQIAISEGTATTGMIVRETSDAIYLRTSQLAEVRIANKNVEAMLPSKMSIMPEGLEKTITRQELSDLLEFLYSQK
jgi:putative heme-binding domain-containing protein